MSGLRGLSRPARSFPLRQLTQTTVPATSRCASSQAAEAPSATLDELETASSLVTPPLTPEEKKEFRPWKRAADRGMSLPGGRFQYRAPKYTRGPLHPLQSPPSSDPMARDFVPGPFHYPRLKQTFRSTVASDLMTLAYNHIPRGTPRKETPERLRKWDDSSPYHKNRPVRAPRGHPVLPLLERDISFQHIPEIKEVTIASYVPAALGDEDLLIAARTAILAVTGVMPEITYTQTNVVQWKIQKGKRAGVKATMTGNAAWDFVDKCVNLVFPRIKDWEGVRASSGDGSGNISWGFTPDNMALFPEIEVNYGMYPAKAIPGARIFVKTTATSDRHARLLMQAIGLPFKGEFRR